MTPETYVELARGPVQDAPDMAYGTRGPLLDNGIDDAPGQRRWPEEEYAYASPATEWHDFAITGAPLPRCAACHGAEGAGGATLGRAPNLTVLDADTIEGALVNYASGARRSGIMQIVASNLSADQRAGLALYYASLPDRPAPETARGSGDVALGQRIATQGKPEGAVPACTTCHNRGEAGGAGLAALDPPSLAGQSAIYIEQQLRLFAAGARSGASAWHPMSFIAGRLDAEEMAGLASYFAQMPPGAEIGRQGVLAFANPAAGREVVERVCDECHTVLGIGSQSGDVPNLTLHTPDYIYRQLVAFRHDYRPNSQMGTTAKFLEPQELADAAAYFGGLPAVAVDREVPAEAVARGAEIARQGRPDLGVPACLTCHGQAPVGELEILPRLHGQNLAYLTERLDQFAGDTADADLDGARFGPMHEIASALSDAERADVAAWFSAQEPLGKSLASR